MLLLSSETSRTVLYLDDETALLLSLLTGLPLDLPVVTEMFQLGSPAGEVLLLFRHCLTNRKGERGFPL
jgi:hypothetical protein